MEQANRLSLVYGRYNDHADPQVNLTNDLYQQVRQRANKNNRSVEALLAIKSDAPVELPLALAEELAQLPFLDDAHLWQAARQVASPEKMNESRNLPSNSKRKG